MLKAIRLLVTFVARLPMTYKCYEAPDDLWVENKNAVINIIQVSEAASSIMAKSWQWGSQIALKKEMLLITEQCAFVERSTNEKNKEKCKKCVREGTSLNIYKGRSGRIRTVKTKETIKEKSC